MAATISNIGWYTSVIIIISRGQNRYQSRFSELIPKNSLNGEEIIAEVDPVIAKTVKILAIWRLEDMPHLVLSFSNIYPSNLIIWPASSIPILSWASFVAAPICGVKDILGFINIFISGFGSFSKVSNAAKATFQALSQLRDPKLVKQQRMMIAQGNKVDNSSDTLSDDDNS